MLPSTKPQPPKLLDQVRDIIRVKHYSYRTEESYIYWIRRYILFYNKQHPKDMGCPEITAFLTHLAVTEKVAASTQNQALSALLFLYRYVLQQPLESSIDAVRAKQSQHLPTVLTPIEVRQIIQQLLSVYKLKQVANIAGIINWAKYHTFHHSFATTDSKTVTIFAPFKNCYGTFCDHRSIPGLGASAHLPCH